LFQYFEGLMIDNPFVFPSSGIQKRIHIYLMWFTVLHSKCEYF
jgi:hypothetical protein